MSSKDRLKQTSEEKLTMLVGRITGEAPPISAAVRLELCNPISTALVVDILS